jgi:hypothetical protein
MVESVDLSGPAARREALRSVDLDDPRPHHAMLQEIFDLERRWREGPDQGGSDEYEQIYVTAFLLFLIGDPADAPRLYGAKFRTRDMDLGIGFDAQAIFGAGRSETLDWLLEHGYTDEHEHLSQWLSEWEDPGSKTGPATCATTSTRPTAHYFWIRCRRRLVCRDIRSCRR